MKRFVIQRDYYMALLWYEFYLFVDINAHW